ncbi:acyltransferase domain-containing protein, partial [bacterium]|nr:acyltransferase domain-containing protein [bacterium]
NIGHLKGAAGAAGVAKVAFALDKKILPPSANFERPNPNIDFEHMPFFVNTKARDWEKPPAEIRRAAVSSFGFGGTNFHVVMEEYVPGYHQERNSVFSMPANDMAKPEVSVASMPVAVSSKVVIQNDEVKEYVLAAVSEKTGYPAEMLDTDLDLEADLGVDTVKQAELFATIRQHYDIPRREDLRLSEYNTLAKVIQFVLDNVQNQSMPAEEIKQAEMVVEEISHEDLDVKAFVIQQVAEKTGYPAEMLDLELDLEADLGVDTVKQAELFASMREHYGIPRKDDLRLTDYNTLAKVINFFKENVNASTAYSGQSTVPTNKEIQTTSSTVSSDSKVSQETTHFRGLQYLGADTLQDLKSKLEKIILQAKNGSLPPTILPDAQALTFPERLVIDYSDVDEFLKRAEKALKGFESNTTAMWQALTAQSVYYGNKTPGKIAFLFPGQGSQYVNMLKEFRAIEPVVDEVFVEADRVMTPLLGKPLTDFIYADGDEESLKAAEAKLKDTTITQPAVLTANVALLRLLQKYGFKPDMVIGHSLG